MVWTLGGDFDPAFFDLVDSYQDGELTAVDNTCLSTMGMKKVSLPNQCSIAPPAPEKKKSGGCIKGPMPDPNIYGHTEWNQDLCKWVAVN